jgi:Concanavalin A-like lectin/glucanases superfamily
MSSKAPLIMGIVVIAICCSCSLAAGAYAMSSSSTDTTSSPSGPASQPAAPDPKTTLLSSGQALQVPEAEISTSPPAFTVPTGIDTSKVSYTMSMDVNIAQSGPSWRNIMNNGAHDCCDATSRRPAVFITGNDAAPPNRIHIVHGANEDNNKNIVTTFAATLGTYFNLTWVVDGGNLTTYINGQKDATGSVSATFRSTRRERKTRLVPSRSRTSIGGTRP